MEERKRIKLSDLERKHPFKVPEGYFDTLATTLLERVNEMPAAEPPATQRAPQPIRIGNRWRLPAIAASVALIVGLVWFTLPARQGDLGPDVLSAVSDEEILDYLESQDLDYYDLASQDVVQKAFMDESTLMHFLDRVDEGTILELLEEDLVYDETI